MAQRAGRVGVNPADVNPVTGHVNVEVPGNVYTKSQVDNKFLTKTKAASDYQGKNLAVPIQMLDGSKLTVEDALQGLNSQKQNMQLAVPIHMLDGTKLTVETALQGLNSDKLDKSSWVRLSDYDIKDGTTVLATVVFYENVKLHLAFVVIVGTSNTMSGTHTVLDADTGLTEIPAVQCSTPLIHGDQILVRNTGNIEFRCSGANWISGSIMIPTVARS